VWLGLSSGLYHDDGSSTTRVFPLDGEGFTPVSALATDQAGGLYFDCRRGPQGPWQLVRHDGQRFEVLHSSPEAPGHLAALLVGRDGSLWLALGVLETQGAGGGLARLTADGRWQRWGVVDGLVDARAMDLAEDGQGRLWIATLGGLSCFDGHGFRGFTRADGLPGHQVLCLCFDAQGRLWLGLQTALAVYDGCAFQYQWLPELGSIRDLAEDADRTLWLGTDRGVWCYRPQEHRPRAQICRVIADRVHEGVSAVHVPASVHQLEFEYRGLSLRTPVREMLYRHRLRGREVDWQRPTRARQARYGQLPAGAYVFEVQAIDRDLNYSEPVQVRVAVEPDPHLEGLSRVLGGAQGAGDFVGDSAALQRALAQMRQVAPTDSTVLILGETGTGKGLAARTLHALSTRQRGPFITVSCGAVPETLIESELFGHERGAFTGADRRQLGKVELARGGTLFLDEIGDLPLAAQSKLLRLLDEGTFARIGGAEELRCEARLVAATNRDLRAMVAAGVFRQDLYYRLRVFELELPPLRVRREDIDLLALYFMQRTAAHLHKPEVSGFSPVALALLRQQRWPGNVRELEHLVQRAVIVSRGPAIEPADLGLAPPPEGVPAAGGGALAPGELVTLAEYERRYIEQVLAATRGLSGVPPARLASWGFPPRPCTAGSRS